MHTKSNTGNIQRRRLEFAGLISLLILIFTLSFASPTSAESGTLYVDDDGICDGNTPCYTVIQNAINVASQGDTIFVFAGTYYEDLVFDKSLTLTAEDLDTTIIIPNDTEYPIDVTGEDVIVTMQEAGMPAVSSFLMSSVSADRFVDDDGICGGNVPCYTIIQSAVNAASSGEVIYIYSGTYYERVTIGRSLTLQGEDRDTTIVDGSGTGNVVSITTSNVTIDGLTIRNGDNGIYVIPNYSVHHFTFRNAVVTANVTEGIELGHSHYYGNHVLENCVISNNGAWGVYAHQFYNSVIRNCDVFGNSSGLDPAWGLGTLVTGNRVYNNAGSGIWFDSMRNSVAENNRVWGNRSVGVGLGYVASYNIVRDNAICANGYGLHANYSPVRYNRVYHNDLEANTTQASELGFNYWDNGYPSGGNYWADYTGVDTDLDGIGDTPYTFSGSQDNYPLIEPSVFAPPLVTAFTAPLAPIQVNTAVQVSATFSDPDSYFLHTGEWDWGDETTSPAVVDEIAQTITGTHIYTAPGVYTVSLTLDDLCGPAGSATYEYVVVYDPEGGFVTGGGWIWSPLGAYVPDDTLEGKATFGFVSKYKKGATVPTGSTEFQFHVADLNFKSTSYDWLVIAGSKAKYKGTGTINGMGEYGFMLSAIDGSPDMFRIKIWDKATESVVYDNQIEAADDADPVTALGGGSIVVHKAK